MAANYHITIVEDATEAFGSCWLDNLADHLGCLAAFFTGNKIITTGGGGYDCN